MLKQKITGYIFIILLVAATFFLITSMTKKRRDWRENYIETSKEPYGSFVITGLLKNYFPGKKFVEQSESIATVLPNPDTLKSTANYVFIGDGYWADSADIDRLNLFVHEGNNAFIAANEITNYLFARLRTDTCKNKTIYVNRLYEDTIAVSLTNNQIINTPATRYTIRESAKSFYQEWTALLPNFVNLYDTCSYILPPHVVLGKISGYNYNVLHPEESDNFIKIPYGKGNFYIHCNPVLFSNYCLTDSLHADYAGKVFSHLPAGDIYWDKKSRIARDEVRNRNNDNQQFSKESPLRYILAQPALRWAWFIFLGLIALYLLYFSKRRQRIIPLMPDKSNTALDFIKSIARLHHYQRNYAYIGQYKVMQFKNDMAKRYRLSQNLTENNFTAQLSVQSNVPDFQIQSIIEFGKKSARHDMKEEDLINLHKLITQFYSICK